MVLRPHKRAVGTFENRRDTERALAELKDSGFVMDRVSVIARDSETPNRIGETEVHDHHHGNKADDAAKAGALTGGALGGLTGLLVGLGALAIPGIGPIILAGAAATTVATTVAGGAIGAAAGGLLGALVGLGIPEEHARTYNDRVSKGHYLVLIDGTDVEISRAEDILRRRGIEDWNVFDIPQSEYRTESREPVAVDREADTYDYRAIGVFKRRRDADAALDELMEAGFPGRQVYVVGRDYDRHPHREGFRVQNRFDNKFMGFLGDRNSFFNDRFERGDYLVIVEGTPEDVRRAETLLNRRGIQEWAVFRRPDSDRQVEDIYIFNRDERETGFKHGVGVFPTREAAEYALTELRNADFPMDRVSVVAHDSERMNRIPDINRMNRVDNYAGLGIFDYRAKSYHNRVEQGHYLVIVRGTENDLREVQSILGRQGVQDFDIYDSTAVSHPTTSTSERIEVETEHAKVVSRDPKVKVVDRRDDAF